MHTIVGIDEVGRGCWAGPLVAAAVILDHDYAISKLQPWKLTDSKVLTRPERERADIEIRKTARAVGLGWVSPQDVDALGLTVAVGKAMKLALDQITLPYDRVVIDGNYNFLREDARATTLVRADALIPAVSAASIVAKVARDTYMIEASLQHKGYGFEKHVGYGTRLHQEQLKLRGVCPLHRLSYKPVQAMVKEAAS
jgi:ribonuclease HII